ncbi:acyl-CoA dehydrogenase family protein [Nocardioides sp. AE5]|uniref:acyl-CoA dehydrogenase family protein n=1 Tax=Nocardioides sp. AE5 TaxID=2962573 RepID=UPI0028820EDC|nr:acyl-CoA dehydrogenase family protein [Nocardioides sp. AE5]MDT0201788.1 acyl-CoA dehydrogenase family protein [Nocardioides sp. AE5]
MDFSFTPEQDEAAELAARILADRATTTRMREVEQGGDRFDRALWSDLAEAGLLSLAIPEAHGGAGLGLIELCRVLVEVGRRVAPVPLASHGPAALALAEFGEQAVQAEWLPGAASGERVLAPALSEPLDPLPSVPSTTLTVEGDELVLDGTKTLVRAGTSADLFLVTASTPSGAAVVLVRPDDAGVTVEAQHTSDGDATALVTLAGVRVPADRLLGRTDGVAATRLGHLVTVAACAEVNGIVAGAVRLTADYAKTREQFGRPIGTFQAVAQRLADGYIDSLFQELTLWQAVWRLAEGLPVETELPTAKLWAADAAHKVAHTTVHVHGGVGIDLDGEAHRYFTAAKRFEFVFGGTTGQALAIGKALAAR